MPHYNRFKNANTMLKYLAVGQSYFLIAFGFAILVAAPSFGSTPECNANIYVSIFAPIKLLSKARILGLVFIGIVTVVHTALLVNDYRDIFGKTPDSVIHIDVGQTRDGHVIKLLPLSTSTTGSALPPSPRPSHTTSNVSTFSELQPPHVKICGRICIHIGIILVFSILAIVNTELLRTYNKIHRQDGSWGFGQV
jgi:hypothetical protein